VLASAQGIGAVLSAPVVAGELDRVQRSRLQFGAVLGYAACVAVLGLAPAFWMGFLALAALGAVHLTSASNLNSVVQLQVDDAVRGRVMAIYLMGVLGTAPFANLLMGWLIAVFDVRPVVVGGGVLLLVAALFLAGSGRLRHLDA
jgi:MFS family permease